MGEILEMKNTKRPLFDEPLRTKLNEGIRENAGQDPELIVNRTEDIICSHIVLTARELGERFAKFLVSKFSKP